MPRTIESIVECYRAARDRQRSGRPIWDHKFEIPSMEGRELTPKIAIQAARSIVLAVGRRLDKYRDLASPDYSSDFEEVIDNISWIAEKDPESLDPGDHDLLDCFCSYMDDLYDWADSYRVCFWPVPSNEYYDKYVDPLVKAWPPKTFRDGVNQEAKSDGVDEPSISA